MKETQSYHFSYSRRDGSFLIKVNHCSHMCPLITKYIFSGFHRNNGMRNNEHESTSVFLFLFIKEIETRKLQANDPGHCFAFV